QLAMAAHMDPEIGEEVAASALVMSADEIGHVAEFLRIITALVARAANDTIRAARVFELEKLRDDMMDMIVHDLRTPLTGVMSSLQTIEASQYDAEIVNEFVPAALESSRMLLELVNTLLDVSKLETGQITLDIGPLRFEDIVREAVAQVKPLADDRSHELHLALDRECPVIQADEDMLRRTLVNLLANAIKFTPRGGRVGLSARCDEMGLTFSVSDNGPGIPPEYRDKIFDKFGQVETRKAGPAHSTGIGLTFCKLVADAHGGRIWLDTEVGKGSRFFLFIPFQPPQQ
ncbi:MAG: sensor histidine kinase, partial [Armatimonadota bacterium]